MTKVVSIITIALAISGFAYAQTNNAEFLVNWKSSSLVPSFYQGKALAINLSTINIGFELVKNGGLVNLSGYEIRWLVNGSLIASGIGLQSTQFTANTNLRDLVVTIIVKGFNGGDLEKALVIPLVSPESVFEKRTGLLYAWPYFFNVKSLSNLIFNWEINGQKTSGQVRTPNVLELTIFPTEEPFPVNASVVIQNGSNLLERSQSIIKYE